MAQFDKAARRLSPSTGAEIVIWQGGAAHVRMGTAGGSTPAAHSHFALQLSVSTGSPIQFRSGSSAEPECAPGWLVASNARHWMQCDVEVHTLFLDPVAPEGRRLALRLHGKPYGLLSNAERVMVLEQLRPDRRRSAHPDALQLAARRVVARLSPAELPVPPLDARVERVLAALSQDPARNTPFREVAALVHLSQSRLAHLFTREVGIPFRQYRLTLRMERAVREITRGRSLTSAALAAGFADSAQFSRICKRMFGNAPSRLPRAGAV